MANITYTSDNGYTGILYGESSLSIGKLADNGEFKECFHTGSRAFDTYEELKEHVEDFPNFLKVLFGGD